MIDKLIVKNADGISYNEEDISKIQEFSNLIKKNIEGQKEFGSAYLEGSFMRETIVKEINDIDLYFEYKGKANPKFVIEELNTCLKNQYPDIDIKKEQISIEMNLNDLPFSITPILNLNNTIAVPDKQLRRWKIVKKTNLINQLMLLKQKNKDYLKLIKIIKLWNKNHHKGFASKEIEQKVIKQFLFSEDHDKSISEWLWAFFIVQGFYKDACKIEKMKNEYLDDIQIEKSWKKFIENN